MVANVLHFDFTTHCPHLSCGEVIGADGSSRARVCEKCGSDLITCSSCRATNRLLAGFCRRCKERIKSEVCTVQRALQAEQAIFNSIQKIAQMHAPFPKRFGGRLLASPLAADGIIILPFNDGSVLLVSESSGSSVGRISVSGAIAVTPALKDGYLYVAAGNNLEAFDLSRFLCYPSKLSFKPEWSARSAGDAVIFPLLVDDTAVYLIAGEGEQILLEAVSRSDGSQLWPEPLRFGSNQTALPVLVENMLMLVALDGEASIIDLQRGDVAYRFSLRSTIDPHVYPYVVNDRVLLADRSGSVLEIILSDSGPLCNQLFGQRGRISSLAASDSYIAVGHMAGLTLLNSRGHLLWSNNSLEPVSVSPIIAGETIFAIDDSGVGLLFDALRSNPLERVKMLSGEISVPPLMTRSNIAAATADGELSLIAWG